MVEAGRQHTMTKGTIPVSAANTATRTGKAGPAGGVIQHAHISKLLGTGSSHPVHFKKEVMMDEIFTIVYVALLKKKKKKKLSEQRESKREGLDWLSSTYRMAYRLFVTGQPLPSQLRLHNGHIHLPASASPLLRIRS